MCLELWSWCDVSLTRVLCFRWTLSSWGTCALPRNTTRRGWRPSPRRRHPNRWGKTPESQRCTDVLQKDFIPSTIKPCFDKESLSVSWLFLWWSDAPAELTSLIRDVERLSLHSAVLYWKYCPLTHMLYMQKWVHSLSCDTSLAQKQLH